MKFPKAQNHRAHLSKKFLKSGGISLGLLGSFFPLSTMAMIYTVTTPNDPIVNPDGTIVGGGTSLRSAILLANASGAFEGIAGAMNTINFTPSAFTPLQTIHLNTELPMIFSNLTISGPQDGLILDGSNANVRRGLMVFGLPVNPGDNTPLQPQPIELTLTNLTMQNFNAQGGTGSGGGMGAGGALFVGSNATVTIQNVDFVGNQATGGAGGAIRYGGGGGMAGNGGQDGGGGGLGGDGFKSGGGGIGGNGGNAGNGGGGGGFGTGNNGGGIGQILNTQGFAAGGDGQNGGLGGVNGGGGGEATNGAPGDGTGAGASDGNGLAGGGGSGGSSAVAPQTAGAGGIGGGGGSGVDGFGGAGGFGGGGGYTNANLFAGGAVGANGGFGGGGGECDTGNGGNGGFGAGGGFGAFVFGPATGGNGGFGAGGGGGQNGGGNGGFGGGNGGLADATGFSGGGGAAMGGSIFVQGPISASGVTIPGGNLIVQQTCNLSGGNLTAGTGGAGGSTPGQAFGTGIFLQGDGGTLNLNPVVGFTQTFSDQIVDQTGVGGTGGNVGSWSLTKLGGGTSTLSGVNRYSGGTFLNGGILRVSADNNLGSPAGPLTFNDGILETTAGFLSGRNVTLNGGGEILGGTFQIDGIGNTTTLNGNITGAGALTKTGAGDLTLLGVNTYTGGTTIGAGTLTGNTASLTGNIFDNGTLVFDQGTDGTFSGNINGTGQLTKTGSGTATMAGNYTGLTGLATIAQGQLRFTTSAPANIFLGNPSAVVGFAPSASTIFAYGGHISGTGDVVIDGPGTVAFTGPNKTYTGNTIVNQGIFSLNSGLTNSPVFVNSGATLEGTGSMQALNVSGVVSPGNPIGPLNATGDSIGTLSVTDNYIMGPSATYITELRSSGASDLIAVGGAAQLNGSLNVVSGNSPQSLKNTVYTILTATEGVTGTFANIIEINRLKFAVQYLPTAVKLFISPFQDFADAFPAGDKSNAARTARYLDTFANNAPVGSDLASVINVLDGYLNTADRAGLSSALNQIQPSLFREFGFLSFAQATLVNKSVRRQQQYRREGLWEKPLECICPTRVASFRRLVENQPMRGFLSKTLSSGTGKPKKKGLGFAQEEGNIRGAPVAQRVRNELTSMWIEPYGQVNEKYHNSHGGSRNGNVGLKSHTYGMSLGGDVQVQNNAFVGLLGGYSNTPFDWKSHRGNGHMYTTNLGVYGSWLDDNGFYVDGQVIGGNNRFKSWRKIAFGSINRTARESHRAFQLSADGEIGYGIPLPCFVFQPFLNLDYVLVHENSYREKGAQSLNMHVKSKIAQFFQGELGATIYHTYVVDEILIRPAFQVGWVQKRPFDHNSRVKGGLVGQPQALTVIGDNRVRNQFAPAVSLTAQFPNGFNMTANVSAEVFDGQNTGEALLRLGYDF